MGKIMLLKEKSIVMKGKNMYKFMKENSLKKQI